MQALNKYVWLLILVLSMTAGLGAQSQKQFKEAAAEYYKYGDYANAAYHFGRALEFDTTDQNLRFQRAESNLLYRSYKLALKDFERLERDGALPNIPRLPYLQGKAAQPLGLYDVAIDYFSLFLTNTGNAPAEEVADAKRQISNSEWAKEIVADYDAAVTAGTQDRVFPIHYTNVNTRYDDFGPAFERDRFYFSSLRFRVEKDTISPDRKVARILRRNAGGNELLNKQLPESINQKNRTAAHSAFNTAGNTVYFTYCEYVTDTLSMRCDLYSASVGADGEWTAPQKLSLNADGANNTHPNVGMHADSSEFLYFASDRSGGKGMHDLYRAPIGADGTLGSVEPLTKLNTAFDDVTPFYFGAQRELYFSTDGRNTLGGLDVYRSSLNKNSWTEPVHLGLPTNSSYNDVYYGRVEERDTAYFASNRYAAEALFWDEEKDVCCNDIYKVEIEKICLEVTTWHDVTKEELNATTVTFYEEHADGERVELAVETHPEDNFYTFEVEKGRKYGVTGIKRGFKGDEAVIDQTLFTKSTKGAECVKIKLYLPPPTITLEVVTLNKDDRTELDSCTVRLSSGPDDNGPFQQDANDTKADSHFYAYDIVLERYYEIFGNKEGYSSDSAIVDTRGLFVLNDTIIKRELLLERDLPECIEPTVFFHNDRPIKGNPHTITPANYMDTYDTYVGTHKPKYYSVWAKSQVSRKGRLDAYFTEEVDKGAEDLKAFAAMLKEYLARDGSLTVTLQGFASPLSNGPYNDKLSARRCISVINYLWNYEGGVLQEYMQDAVIVQFNKANKYKVPTTYKGMPVVTYQGNKAPAQSGKSLIFDIKPGGEVPVGSRPGLVDSGDDSVYSPVAGGARYVEIKIEGCGNQSDEEIPEPDTREY